MEQSLNEEKKYLRKRLLAQRAELSSALSVKWSQWAQMHFLGSQCYRASKKIALYAAKDREVDTRMIFDRAQAEKKIIAFPRIIGKGEMVFLKVESYEKMIPNQYGILEPRPDWEEIRIEELELILVPGVAFDRRGYRLGFGGGYYDRVLARLKPEVLSCGFAYSFQVLPSLPVDRHDQKVKRLITEQGFIRLSSNSETEEECGTGAGNKM